MSESLRIDKLLWFLRLAKTRGAAQELVEAAHIRLYAHGGLGRRVERCSVAVAAGDVIVLPKAGAEAHGVRIIAILSLPKRRGPAFEAQSHYQELDETSASALAAAPIRVASERILQP